MVLRQSLPRGEGLVAGHGEIAPLRASWGRWRASGRRLRSSASPSRSKIRRGAT
jgi:hypothetical protein